MNSGQDLQLIDCPSSLTRREYIGPMGDMAKDMMDYALAETLSRGPGSIGIAKTIFVDMAQRLVRKVDLQRADGKDRPETKA